jgi:hypothetical protein
VSNSDFGQSLVKRPLVRFSVYTDIQAATIVGLGEQILNEMDNGLIREPKGSEPKGVDGTVFNKVNGLFWIWVLGSYEVVRTMTQAKGCFSSNCSQNLQKLKKTLSLLRIPFAKQELPGKKKTPVAAEPSISSVQISPPDLEFKIDETVLSIRAVIQQFRNVFDSITPEDVLADHRTLYKSRG